MYDQQTQEEKSAKIDLMKEHLRKCRDNANRTGLIRVQQSQRIYLVVRLNYPISCMHGGFWSGEILHRGTRDSSVRFIEDYILTHPVPGKE